MKKVLAVFLVLLIALMPALAQAQAAGLGLNLPKPGDMVGLSAPFRPTALRGLTVHPDAPLKFDFILDSGDEPLEGDALKAEGQKLVNYFLAAMTVPRQDLWVNLSPVENNRILPEALVSTEFGREFLTQDYLLKQLTASLIYPEDVLGKKFWDQVYALAQARLGTTDIPLDTFNKVWIIPETATVYEKGNTVYITRLHLKVQLESDYLAKSGELSAAEQISKQILREVIVPVIEKEVNEGSNFAPLRQAMYSLVLAQWYQSALKESILNKAYAGKSKVAGIDVSDPANREQIYARYMEAYKKGVFNYIKEETAGQDGKVDETIPRKYFSGGVNASQLVPLDHAAGVTSRQRPRYPHRLSVDVTTQAVQAMLTPAEAEDRNARLRARESIQQQVAGMSLADKRQYIKNSAGKNFSLERSRVIVEMLISAGQQENKAEFFELWGRAYKLKIYHDLPFLAAKYFQAFRSDTVVGVSMEETIREGLPSVELVAPGDRQVELKYPLGWGKFNNAGLIQVKGETISLRGFSRDDLKNPVAFLTALPSDYAATEAEADKAQSKAELMQWVNDMIDARFFGSYRKLSRELKVAPGGAFADTGFRQYHFTNDPEVVRSWLTGKDQQFVLYYRFIAFQISEFKQSVARMEPLLMRLGRSRDDIRNTIESIQWLNTCTAPFTFLIDYMLRQDPGPEINALLPQRFYSFTDSDLGKLALTVAGQRLKRAILEKFFSDVYKPAGMLIDTLAGRQDMNNEVFTQNKGNTVVVHRITIEAGTDRQATALVVVSRDDDAQIPELIAGIERLHNEGNAGDAQIAEAIRQMAGNTGHFIDEEQKLQFLYRVILNLRLNSDHVPPSYGPQARIAALESLEKVVINDDFTVPEMIAKYSLIARAIRLAGSDKDVSIKAAARRALVWLRSRINDGELPEAIRSAVSGQLSRMGFVGEALADVKHNRNEKVLNEAVRDGVLGSGDDIAASLLGKISPLILPDAVAYRVAITSVQVADALNKTDRPVIRVNNKIFSEPVSPGVAAIAKQNNPGLVVHVVTIGSAVYVLLTDNSQAADPSALPVDGGIDARNVGVERKGELMTGVVDNAALERMITDAPGLQGIIVDIKPVTNFSALLGLKGLQ
ncbi:MAG: hypothetical protein HQL20_08300 [Candidatus Omnitrophica bacterium]|nr:hypothetical protein [Candidatus Omnitrophota bacterium]